MQLSFITFIVHVYLTSSGKVFSCVSSIYLLDSSHHTLMWAYTFHPCYKSALDERISSPFISIKMLTLKNDCLSGMVVLNLDTTWISFL